MSKLHTLYKAIKGKIKKKWNIQLIEASPKGEGDMFFTMRVKDTLYINDGDRTNKIAFMQLKIESKKKIKIIIFPDSVRIRKEAN